MKRLVIVFILLSLIYNFKIQAQTLPEKDSVLGQMILANKYFMDKWPDPGEDIVTDKTRASNLWTRATYYEGLMAFYYVYSDTNYYQYAVDWGESHEWKLSYDVDFSRDADYQCCTQTYIELYQLDNQYERIETVKNCIDIIKAGDDFDDWSWIDAIQMAMPVYAKLGVVLEDTSYFNAMHKFYMYSRDHHGDSGLYNDVEHLWWRDEDFDPPHTTPNGKNQYWSRGNGWVLAALTRVLDVIPEDYQHYNEYLTTFKEMCDTLINIQRYDGFWNPSLVDSTDYGGKETSGTAFFTYGIAWGINNGILDEATFKPSVVKAWNGMIKDALHSNGFLGWMQGTGSEPSDGQPLSYDKVPNFEDYGLGAFLLAGSEVIKMAPGVQSHTKPSDEYYQIETTVIGQGSIDGSADSVLQYTNIELTAVPDDGWRFVNWSGSVSSYDNPITLNILTDVSIMANFEKEPPMITIQENETGFCGVDGSIDDNRDDFTGDGFANTDNVLGNGINYQVQFAQTGSYTFIFKYASLKDRPAKLLLDDSEILTIDFPSTDSWSVWDSVSASATIDAGNYSLRLEGTTSNALGNIDYMTIEGDSAFATNCQSSVKLNKEDEISIYPTIIENEFVVTIPATLQENIHLQIFDITGKIYLTEQISETDNTIDVSHLKPGIYFVRTTSQVFTETRKIIIK